MPNQPDMRRIMQQAQKMQDELAKVQAKMAEREFEGSAGGGMVTAKVNGGPELIEVKIDPAVIDPDDAEMLEDLVLAAVRQAMDAAVEAASNHLGGLTGGMGAGGLLD